MLAALLAADHGCGTVARSFAEGTPRGRAFDLQAERVDCDGRFDRFATLERRWR